MIERKIIDGRSALVAEMSGGLIKVVFDDGEIVILAPSEAPKKDYRTQHGQC